MLKPWKCTHCRDDCPHGAQCHTYVKVNKKRKSKRSTTAEGSNAGQHLAKKEAENETEQGVSASSCTTVSQQHCEYKEDSKKDSNRDLVREHKNEQISEIKVPGCLIETESESEAEDEASGDLSIVSQDIGEYKEELPKPSKAFGCVGMAQKCSDVKEAPSKAWKSCHLCERIPYVLELKTCINVESGCRKITCEECFEKNGWDWDTLFPWVCTHCRILCPPGARCCK